MGGLISRFFLSKVVGHTVQFFGLLSNCLAKYGAQFAINSMVSIQKDSSVQEIRLHGTRENSFLLELNALP